MTPVRVTIEFEGGLTLIAEDSAIRNVEVVRIFEVDFKPNPLGDIGPPQKAHTGVRHFDVTVTARCTYLHTKIEPATPLKEIQ